MLDVRADLMLELTAIEATPETWITQLRDEPQVTSEILREPRIVNDEIVDLANEIVELHGQITGGELLSLNQSNSMLPSFSVRLLHSATLRLRGIRLKIRG